MKNYFKHTLVGMLALTLIMSPLATFAQGDDKDKGRDNGIKVNVENMKSESKLKLQNKCFKAYGHFFAPGWVKKNGQLDIDVSNCWMPFGIGKKFRGPNASTTIDVKAPVISKVVTVVGTSTVQVSWKTNEKTTDRVYYSTILPIDLNASTTSYISNSTGTTTHRMTLIGLNTNTAYHLMIRSTDAAGNVTTSSTFTVRTSVGL